MRIYVAGPMRHIPEKNFPAFNRCAAILREKGHEVLNPVEIGQKHFGTKEVTQQEFLIKDLVEVMTCDGIAVLPGWEGSCGASCEVAVAKTLCFDFFDEEGMPIPPPSAVVCDQSYPPRR